MPHRSTPQTADAEDAARRRAARLVHLHVVGMSPASYHDTQARLRASLSGAEVDWFDDVVDAAAETAACELNPSPWDDGGLPPVTDAELAAMIDAGVMEALEDEDAPRAAFGSGMRM
ncbi:hypothetical protein [Aureimonas sp. N4]|uniref:hypothetical protein n=1 Tax=Aureimonas sp. N4 TaxID=1638165 RepID=UPI0007857BCC|nr:hypothetical protein [Aureimonas sp. N4]